LKPRVLLCGSSGADVTAESAKFASTFFIAPFHATKKEISRILVGSFRYRSFFQVLSPPISNFLRDHLLREVSWNFPSNFLCSLTGFRLWRQYWRQYWGYIFFGGISPSKIGHIAPFLATIQTLSKTCGLLFNKRSEGCFVWAAPSLVLAPTIP
jgi:hypothetical protein